jgi:hypothetical protein
MKRKQLFLFIISISFFFGWQCASQKKTTYVFPPALNQQKRDSLTLLCEKGRLIYKEHCTGCHGIFAKGKDDVPNFSKQQIDMYASRASLRDPTNHAVMLEMPMEQLDAIQLFLLFREHK